MNKVEISPCVSIIIPFYNPKKYFAELLESLSHQSYENIQIVLVDDGSDKQYNLVAQNFISKGGGRVLVTKENGGVASARQVGVEAATGDFIIHADADDFLPDYAIQRLVETCLATNADMVIGGYIVKRGEKEKYVGVNHVEEYWGYVEGLLLGKYHGSLCNKLLKKSLYDSVTFESGLNYMEDKLLLAKILKKGPFTIGYLNEPVYTYRQHANSATMSISLNSIKESVAVVKEIAELYAGIFSNDMLNTIKKKQRAFEIYQSAKKGVNVFSPKDDALIKDSAISLKMRAGIWLAKKRLLGVMAIVFKILRIL